jgi:L-idonate 5-dehydrogenase
MAEVTTARLPDLALAVVVHAVGDLRWESVAVRPPEPHEAVVEVVYGGICGSDLHYWSHGAAGESILREPLVLGHEVVGRVHRAAENGSGPPVGTPVAIHPARPSAGDGSVRYPAASPNLSPAGTYLGSAARLPHTNGGFVRYLSLASDMLRPLAESLPLRTAALIEPASVAWHAVARAGDVAGRRILVVGAGPIGALTVAVLKRAGAAEIVVTDVFPRPLEVAARLGASRTLLAGQQSEIDAVDADVVIESSGSAPGLRSAIRAATRGGIVVMVGLLPPGDSPVPVSLAIARELDLRGSFRFNDEIDEVVAALQDGSLFVDPVVSHEYPAADVLQAFETAKDAATSGKVLLRFDQVDPDQERERPLRS